MGRVQQVTVPWFAGPSNKLRTTVADNEQSINLYPAFTSPGQGGKGSSYLLPTPGIRPVFIMPDLPVRGIFFQDGRGFIVAGSTFCEFFDNYTLGPTFFIENDGQPVSFASNGSAGHQVMVVSGGFGYIYNLIANTFTQITAEGFPQPCLCCEFMDGRFFALKGAGSRQWNISDPEDGTLWDPLNFAERSEASDNLVSMIRSGREMWFGGTKTGEVWTNTGDADFPFAPVSGTFLEYGSQATFAPQRLGNTLIWLAKNEDGNGIVVRANGYTPERISTDAVDTDLQRADAPTDARAWAYQEDGHGFYILVLPRDLSTTWCYDQATGLWHERGTFDPVAGRYIPHVAGCHCFAFERHLVGDRFSGAVYRMSQDYTNEQIVTVADQAAMVA